MSVADDIYLTDHHCHGVASEDPDRAAFESMLSEAEASGPLHGSLFASQVGMGVRAICAPLLDLPRFAEPDDYLARRSELGWHEVTRRMLGATGINRFLVDTGFLPAAMTPPHDLASYVGGRADEIIRLELVAQQVLARTDPRDYAEAFRAELSTRAATAVGFKSIAAYRGGLDLDPSRPSDGEVADGAAATHRDGTVDRVVDRSIIRFGIWTALDLAKPVQFHVGYGDNDVNLDRCDPLLLTPLLRATAPLGVPIMLLHNYPFHRNAGYLAQVFDHVFVDVGLTLHNVGTRADAIFAELLELAPFGSVLFSSDAAALPELYPVATTTFRHALNAFLDDGLARDYWSTRDAERIAHMICAENSARAYRLPAT